MPWGFAAYVAALAVAAHWFEGPRLLPSFRELQNAAALRGWLLEGALRSVCEGLAFVPLGFLSARLLAGDTIASGRRLRTAAALCVTVVILFGVQRVARGTLSPLHGLPGLLGGLLGVVLGARAAIGRRALVSSALAGAAALALGAFLALETVPLEIDVMPLASRDKREIFRRLTARTPRSLAADELHAVSLSEHDLNVLLSWVITMDSSVRRGRVRVTAAGIELEGSMRLPLLEQRPYLNVRGLGRLTADAKRLSLDVDRLRVGAVGVPRFVLRPLAWLAGRAVEQDPRVRAIQLAVRRVDTSARGVEVVYGHAELPPELLGELFHRDWQRAQLDASVRAQAALFTGAGAPWPKGDERTARAAESAFRLARERSVGHSAVRENEAAIVALGMFLGHWRIENLYGSVLEEGASGRAAALVEGATLRGRNDWTRHFFVSAALTVLASRGVSDAGGLFKEELDADGGSGFSFADLLADRSGTTFAQTATANEDAARRLQDRLARGFRVGDYFPPAKDLPEGISDATLTTRYGGVGGPRYRELAAEIERRVVACEAYRAP